MAETPCFHVFATAAHLREIAACHVDLARVAAAGVAVPEFIQSHVGLEWTAALGHLEPLAEWLRAAEGKEPPPIAERSNSQIVAEGTPMYEGKHDDPFPSRLTAPVATLRLAAAHVAAFSEAHAILLRRLAECAALAASFHR